MGIYIKKVLGYGVQMTAEEATERLNSKVARSLYGMSGSSYVDFLTTKYAHANSDDLNYYLNDLHISNVRSLPSYNASNFITVADNGLDGDKEADTVWAIITPPMVCEEWKHNDDPIDYFEESYKYQDTEWKLDQNIKFLNRGLFPYDGSYINHAIGTQLDSSLMNTIHRYIHLMREESTPAEDQALRLLLESVQVSSVEEFKAVIHPAPPVSVVDIAEWTGIFNDTSTARKLRPALLTYWS